MLALERVEVGPERAPCRRPPAATVATGDPGRDGVVGPPRLEDQRRQHRGQLGRAEAVPQPVRAATRRRPGPSRCRSASAVRPRSVTLVVAVEVAERGRARRRPGRTAGRSCWCAARSGARSVLASRSSLNQRSAQRAWSSRSGQPWQGCARSCAPQVLDLGGLAAPAAPPPRPRVPGGGRRQVVGAVAQRRGQVAPRLRVAAVERLRDPHPGERLDRGREVDQREPAGLPVGGEHLAAAGRRGRPHPAGRAPRRYPANLPAGTSITSPGRSASSEAIDLVAPVGRARLARRSSRARRAGAAARRTP